MNKENLLETCGLKWNKEVVLNQDPVYSFLENHEGILQSLNPDLLRNHMEYGVLDDGTLYKIGVKNHLIERLVFVNQIVKPYRRIKAVISYDGTSFSGFQVQRSDRSVQGEIEKVLSEIHHEEKRIAGASRTDAGVHALHQVIHFDTNRDDSLEKWMYYLNRRLPKDIYVQHLEEVHPLFHSRYDVLRKEYRYRLNRKEYNPLQRNYEWFQKDINVDALRNEMLSLVGTHDFTSFSKGDKEDKTRTIFDARVEEQEDILELVFIGDGFLRYMIRLIVFALVKIAKNEMDSTIMNLLEEKSRKKTIHLAPAGGLYLANIEY